MKILHVGPIKPTPGAAGPSNSVRGLAGAQVEIGLDVGLLSSLPLDPGPKMEATPGACVLVSPSRRQYNPWLISGEWIKRIQTQFGVPSLVNFHSTYIPFQIALARRFRKLGWPYIIAPRGGMTRIAQRSKHVKKTLGNLTFFNSYVKNAAAIHALSPGEAEEIRALFKVKKVITVPNGVEDCLFEAAEKLPAADLSDFNRDSDLILGFVGRIDVYIKGLDLLLEALCKLKEKPGRPKCKLFMVGPPHTKRDKKKFVSSIRKLGLQDTVKLLGPKFGQEKWSCFLACDVYVQTSRSEGMPMAVLEAMALRRPCLVTPGTRVSDIVCNGGGWECKPNPKSIAETIKSIYDKKTSLETLGQQSQKLIQKQFTWHKVARQLKAEYDKILKAG